MGNVDVLGVFFLVFWLLLALRLVRKLQRTRDKPPEWRPSSRDFWPFSPDRDGYRIGLVMLLITAFVCIVVTLYLLVAG